MPSILLNQHTGTDIDFGEYKVVFTESPIPGEQILVGYDYLTNDVIAEFRGEQIVIGQLPTIPSDTPYRLLLTTQIDGVNNTYIPYEINFNFSESWNYYNRTNINPFISVLPLPYIDVTHETLISANSELNISINTDATWCIIIELIYENNLYTSETIYVQTGEEGGEPQTNYNYTVNHLVSGVTYIVSVVAYNDPQIYTTYNGNLVVEGTFPEITFTNIVILNDSSVEFTYETLNADYVDIITSFEQDQDSLSPNGTIVFNYLSVNTLYDLTIVARDLNSNFDTLDLHFNIISNIVNNTKGILGLKRGKEL